MSHSFHTRSQHTTSIAFQFQRSVDKSQAKQQTSRVMQTPFSSVVLECSILDLRHQSQQFLNMLAHHTPRHSSSRFVCWSSETIALKQSWRTAAYDKNRCSISLCDDNSLATVHKFHNLLITSTKPFRQNENHTTDTRIDKYFLVCQDPYRLLIRLYAQYLPDLNATRFAASFRSLLVTVNDNRFNKRDEFISMRACEERRTTKNCEVLMCWQVSVIFHQHLCWNHALSSITVQTVFWLDSDVTDEVIYRMFLDLLEEPRLETQQEATFFAYFFKKKDFSVIPSLMESNWRTRCELPRKTSTSTATASCWLQINCNQFNTKERSRPALYNDFCMLFLHRCPPRRSTWALRS
ncbi:hypothetical protein GCK72_025850 [Caenorhabditis remanei]|uniref:Uncharacterized protein n=1 Tax=Caenorhabditis remanei TaxID=31234 RepID=A0A6A5G3V7_CAERE|nr:hypothetical protein GCK72_025850 [Caenorhabditis remanei]KAF1749382.1 hypothetical protein GCK72_025850 [Caenorhabditis remanei]